jgi:hypothetical protein
MKMRRPIVDSIVGCSNAAAYRGSEIALSPRRGKTIRKRMITSVVGLNMAPIRRHRKQTRQSRAARHGSQFDAERFPSGAFHDVPRRRRWLNHATTLLESSHDTQQTYPGTWGSGRGRMREARATRDHA